MKWVAALRRAWLRMQYESALNEAADKRAQIADLQADMTAIESRASRLHADLTELDMGMPLARNANRVHA